MDTYKSKELNHSWAEEQRMKLAHDCVPKERICNALGLAQADLKSIRREVGLACPLKTGVVQECVISS